MKKIAYLFIGILLFSCQSDLIHDFTSTRFSLKRNSNGFHVTEEEAAFLSLGFVNDIKTKTRSNNDVKVKSVIPWTFVEMYPQMRNNPIYNILPDTMLYIVNFNNNKGFVLVPADNRIHGILAYIEEGNLNPSDNINNDGFKFFLNRLPNYYLEKLNRDFGGFDTIPITPGLLDSWETDSLIEPLLTTTWHQFTPFNDSCPIINGHETPAGCVAIATAQVLAHYRNPTSLYGHTYDWDEIMTGTVPQTSAGKQSVAQFVHDIGTYIGTQYDTLSSGAYFSYLYIYLNSLGYDHSPTYYADYNYDLCMESFEDGCPVLIAGRDSLSPTYANHAWVLDGGAIRHYIRFLHGDTPRYQYLVHCNWGWNSTPSLNGYYESGVFDTQNKIADTLTRSSISRHYYQNNSLIIYHHVQPHQE